MCDSIITENVYDGSGFTLDPCTVPAQELGQ